ncbi:MAG: VWA domain-containing protein [Burkholderiales bacterium]
MRWVAVCALLALTFAYPSAAFMRESYRALIVLDITQSMNTVDRAWEGGPVSRFEFAKRSISRALLDLPCGSEVGLAIFTEYRAFLLLSPVEVCANYQELAGTLMRINGQMAWAGASEIAKGLNFTLRLAKGLDSALVFITDGHEAPPLHSQHRPKLGEDRVPGLIAGVGALSLSPIPKFGPDGKPLGYWSADEVLQTDTLSLGRGGSGEGMVDSEGKPIAIQKRSGTEHLSALKETHLIELARQAELNYQRLDGPLAEAIETSALARRAPADSDLRWVFAALALMLSLPLTRLRRTSNT